MAANPEMLTVKGQGQNTPHAVDERARHRRTFIWIERKSTTADWPPPVATGKKSKREAKRRVDSGERDKSRGQ
jgi:hypothetical protein